MAARPEEKKEGPPAYMVSFGDMMTLILTFFILLVSMSHEQAPGLVAEGVGSFMVNLESHGLNGALSGAEKEAIFSNVRNKMGVPEPSEDAEPAPFDQTSAEELLRTKAAEALAATSEISIPNIVGFETGSSELSANGKNFLNKGAATLRPGKGQILVLEGHAADSKGMDPARDRELALSRAQTVRNYLLETHNFVDERVEARIWLMEVVDSDNRATRAVDARLVTPPAQQ